MDEVFQFKQFTIRQSGEVMKVGTDSMLLGAFVQPGDAKKILDIGTGTGVLALMLAQNSAAQIDAIDINEKACVIAEENIRTSSWAKRIKVINIGLQQFPNKSEEKYDLIITNPPFFEPLNTLKGNNKLWPGHERKIARTTETLAFEELIKGVAELLSNDGAFYLVLPFDSIESFASEAANHNLYIYDLLKVRSKPNGNYIRAVMKLKFYKPEAATENELTIRENSGKYSNQYIDFTKDYHARAL